jgi:phenylalanyl-tRNA synthetase beta chain
LARLGFAPEVSGEGEAAILRVTVPSYRTDVTHAADVVEEVARIVGYDTLPETLPAGRVVPVRRDPMYLLQRQAREALVGAGWSEAISYVVTGDEELGFVAPEAGRTGFLHQVEASAELRLRNPIQSDQAVLRPTVLPGLLAAVAENLKHESGVRLFELARVYLPQADSALPREASVAALVLAGQREPLSRYAAAGELDFFDLKGAVETLLARLGVQEASFGRTEHAALHPGRAAVMHAGERLVGLLGELRPDRAAAFGIAADRVGVAELDLDALLTLTSGAPAEVRVPHFLPVEQDFAVVVGEETPAADVEGALRQGAGPLMTGVALFDLYRGPQLGEGRKSLAYRVTFTAPDRALTDAELGKVRTRIEKTLAKQVGGELRA